MVIGLQIGKLHDGGGGGGGEGGSAPPVLPDSEKPGLFRVKVWYTYFENSGPNWRKLGSLTK